MNSFATQAFGLGGAASLTAGAGATFQDFPSASQDNYLDFTDFSQVRGAAQRVGVGAARFALRGWAATPIAWQALLARAGASWRVASGEPRAAAAAACHSTELTNASARSAGCWVW
jgi:hypothetical protein